MRQASGRAGGRAPRGGPSLLAAALGARRPAAAAEPLRRRRRAGEPAARRRCRTSSPDSRGVITYATYQVAVARDGDTIATVAEPASAPRPAELAAPQRPARGLHPAPRRGAAPARQRGRAPVGRASTPARSPPSRSAGRQASAASTAPAATGRRQANPFQNGQTEPLIDPVRHRVEAGETAYSIARLYGVSVTALASWNGLGPDLAVRENQELLIPIVSDANRISSSARHPARPGHAGDAAAERRGAAARRHHRRGRARNRPTSASTARPPGGRLGAAGLRQRHPRATTPRNPNGVGFAVPAGTAGARRRPRRGRAGLRGARRPRHHRAGPPPGRPDHHLLDPRRRPGRRKATGCRPARSSAPSPPRDKPELQFDVFRGTTSVDPTPYLGGG